MQHSWKLTLPLWMHKLWLMLHPFMQIFCVKAYPCFSSPIYTLYRLSPSCLFTYFPFPCSSSPSLDCLRSFLLFRPPWQLGRWNCWDSQSFWGSVSKTPLLSFCWLCLPRTFSGAGTWCVPKGGTFRALRKAQMPIFLSVPSRCGIPKEWHPQATRNTSLPLQRHRFRESNCSWVVIRWACKEECPRFASFSPHRAR